MIPGTQPIRVRMLSTINIYLRAPMNWRSKQITEISHLSHSFTNLRFTKPSGWPGGFFFFVLFPLYLSLVLFLTEGFIRSESELLKILRKSASNQISLSLSSRQYVRKWIHISFLIHWTLSWTWCYSRIPKVHTIILYCFPILSEMQCIIPIRISFRWKKRSLFSENIWSWKNCVLMTAFIIALPTIV